MNQQPHSEKPDFVAYLQGKLGISRKETCEILADSLKHYEPLKGPSPRTAPRLRANGDERKKTVVQLGDSNALS